MFVWPIAFVIIGIKYLHLFGQKNFWPAKFGINPLPFLGGKFMSEYGLTVNFDTKVGLLVNIRLIWSPLFAVFCDQMYLFFR